MPRKTTIHGIFNVRPDWLLLIPIILIGTFVVVTGFYEPHWSFDYSELRPEVREAVVDLRNGYFEQTPDDSTYYREQWSRQEWIAKNANFIELQALLSYPYGAVRLIAIRSLIERFDADQFALLEGAFAEPDSHVFVWQGKGRGTSHRYPLGAYLVDYVYCLNPDIPCYISEAGSLDLSAHQKAELIEMRNAAMQ